MPNVTLIEGDSASVEVFEKLKKLIRPGERVMAILDSDHETEHVLKEMELICSARHRRAVPRRRGRHHRGRLSAVLPQGAAHRYATLPGGASRVRARVLLEPLPLDAQSRRLPAEERGSAHVQTSRLLPAARTVVAVQRVSQARLDEEAQPEQGATVERSHSSCSRLSAARAAFCCATSSPRRAAEPPRRSRSAAKLETAPKPSCS